MCFIFLNPIKYQDLPKKIYFKIFRLELNFVQILEVPKDLNLLGKKKQSTGPLGLLWPTSSWHRLG
jgi:hypothetical protein